MSISKVSRCLVVAIFSVLILLFIFADVLVTFGDLTLSSNMFSKIIYIVSLLILIVIYGLLKEKFSKIKIKKSLSLIYRYIFLITITTVVKLLAIYKIVVDINVIQILLLVIISVLSAVALKKIIYNISKSDLLSVCGMLMFALIPNMVTDKLLCFTMIFVTFFILMVIVFIQKLIDELKQLGIKTEKYMFLSVIVGIFIGITMIFGISNLIWIICAIVLLLVTSNLDKTHVNFPNKIINGLRQKSKEMLYGMERIYIPKIIISVVVIGIFSSFTYVTLNYMFNDINVPIISESVRTFNTGNNVMNNIQEFKNINQDNVITSFKNIINTSKGYILTLSIYILIVEILTVILRRRYDTKSTMIKTLFILLVVFCSFLNLNIFIYSQIITVLLILISIINTSNLYLNRDERIKLLNS